MKRSTSPHWAVHWMLGTALFLLVPVGAAAQPAAAADRLVAQGTQAGLDAGLMQQVVQQAEAAGFNETQIAELLHPAVQLAEVELPARGVLQKALEGLAKRVPAPRVQPVLQQMQAHTEQAGALVRAWGEQPAARRMMDEEGRAFARSVQDELVLGAAQARTQDVPADVVQQLLEALPAETQRRPIPSGDVAVALQVLPEFVGNGAAPETTIELLAGALDAGYGAPNLRQLPAAMHVARQQNRRPTDVLVRNTAQAIAQGTPAAEVLGQLFDGGIPGGGPPGEVAPPDQGPSGQGKPPDTPPGRNNGNQPPGNSGGGQ